MDKFSPCLSPGSRQRSLGPGPGCLKQIFARVKSEKRTYFFKKSIANQNRYYIRPTS